MTDQQPDTTAGVGLNAAALETELDKPGRQTFLKITLLYFTLIRPTTPLKRASPSVNIFIILVDARAIYASPHNLSVAPAIA
jgi:hypothetical protein